MKQITFGGTYPVDPRESQRIDMLKFLAISIVVLLHSFDMDYVFAEGFGPVIKVEQLISQIIGRSMVPTFYLLSAVLLFKSVRNYSQVLKNKAKTVLVPYVLWNTFWIVVFILLQNLSFTRNLFSADSTPILEKNLWQWLQMYGIGAREPMDYPLWYVRDLILVILLSPILYKVTDRFPRTALVAAMIINLAAPASFPMRNALVYTILGAWLVRNDLHMEKLDRIPLLPFAAGYTVLCLGLLFTTAYPLYRLVQLIGVFFWLRLTAVITGRAEKWMLSGAQSVFFIFAAHELTLTFLKKLFYKVAPQSPAVFLLGYFLLPLLVISLCIVTDRILRRLLPRFHTLITGGR